MLVELSLQYVPLTFFIDKAFFTEIKIFPNNFLGTYEKTLLRSQINAAIVIRPMIKILIWHILKG